MCAKIKQFPTEIIVVEIPAKIIKYHEKDKQNEWYGCNS